MCIRDSCSDGTDESPEWVPLVCHPGQFQGTVTQKCIPSGWICDGEPAWRASDKQIIYNSDEDHHRYFSDNISYGPETYCYIKQYDKGNYMSFVANKGITARRMKCKAKAKKVTGTGTSMKTCLLYTSRCV